MTVINWRSVQRNLGKLYPGLVDGQPGPKTWIGLVAYAAPTAASGGDAVTLRGRKLAEVADDYGITTAERIAGFLSNTTHETGDYERLRENLYFTSGALIRATWPTRFATAADARLFVRNPEALANKVYARPREGNLNLGDGWRYRGGGDFQVTFANGYHAAELDLGLPLLAHPELIETPAVALLAGLAYWRRAKLAQYFDAKQPKRARAVANAGNPDFPNPVGWNDVSARHERLMELLV